MFLRRRPLRNRIQTKRALASWIPSLWLMTQRRGKCDLIDPAFENQNFWKDFNLKLLAVLALLSTATKIFDHSANWSPPLLWVFFLGFFRQNQQSHIQVCNAFGSGSIFGELVALEELLVLGLQQGITGAGFGEDEQRHCGCWSGGKKRTS